MASDLRSALRSLGKSPGFTAVLLLIGAHPAVFSVAPSLRLRPRPMEDPGRVVRLATGLLLAAVVLLACSFPSRAAAQMDPIAARPSE